MAEGETELQVSLQSSSSKLLFSTASENQLLCLFRLSKRTEIMLHKTAGVRVPDWTYTQFCITIYISRIYRGLFATSVLCSAFTNRGVVEQSRHHTPRAKFLGHFGLWEVTRNSANWPASSWSLKQPLKIQNTWQTSPKKKKNSTWEEAQFH